MLSAAAPPTFILALASPGSRRRDRECSFPPFRGGAILNFRFWAPPRTPWNAAVVRAEAGAGGKGAAAVRAEAGAGLKDAAAPERKGEAATQPRARRGGAGKPVSWSCPGLEIGRPVRDFPHFARPFV
jgi:hypothetical protein